MKKIIMIMAVTITMTSCGGGNTKEADSSTDSVSMPEAAPNDSEQVCQPVIGNGQMQTMGKVVAERYADLAFETALPIEQVFVRNGQQVRRGQVIAQLDQFKLRNAILQQERAIEQAQLQIEQARLEMQDVIISQGYDPDKDTSIPDDVRHNADVKSGYALTKSQLVAAQTQLAAARHELRTGVLTAPFDGIIANVAMQAHQLAQAGQTVCRVIASGDMAVEFRVMEADLTRYPLGTTVTVVPVADKAQRYDATVSEINPIVDEQGAVTIRAHLTDATTLFDGMNVEVVLKIEN